MTYAAGRDLDRIVHEKIMSGVVGDSLSMIPHYSTDLNDAWKVVKRLRDLGWWLSANAYFNDEAGCNAGFTPKNSTGWNGRPDHKAHAATLQHAICLAALDVIAFGQS